MEDADAEHLLSLLQQSMTSADCMAWAKLLRQGEDYQEHDQEGFYCKVAAAAARRARCKGCILAHVLSICIKRLTWASVPRAANSAKEIAAVCLYGIAHVCA